MGGGHTICIIGGASFEVFFYVIAVWLQKIETDTPLGRDSDILYYIMIYCRSTHPYHPILPYTMISYDPILSYIIPYVYPIFSPPKLVPLVWKMHQGPHGGERGRRWGALLSRQRCRDPSDTAELRLERLSIGSRWTAKHGKIVGCHGKIMGISEFFMG